MSKQSEQILEEQLIALLKKQGYQYLIIEDESGLIKNLKFQLEKHNGIKFSNAEFDKVLNILNNKPDPNNNDI